MGQLFSLNMLVQAVGRERQLSEYTLMLKKAGFDNVQLCRTGKPYDAILALRWAQDGTVQRGTRSVQGLDEGREIRLEKIKTAEKQTSLDSGWIK